MNPAPEQKIPHILILEDDASHRELCIRAFRDDPDRFRVSVVATIRDARSVIEQDPPDLIFADWLLSEGRGIDILPRKDGRVAIPLIIMTSHGDEKIAVEVMKSGAVDYLVKSASLFKGLPHIARRSLDFWKNIQERKRAEEEAAESHKRLADILNFLPDATFAIDHEGRVIAWNRAIAEMTGVSAEAILGKGDYEYSIPFYGKRRPILIDLVDMDEAAILEKKYDYVKLEEGKITSEIYIPTLFGGRGAYLWGTASPLFDSAGTKVGAIEVIRDITKRKEDEDLLTRRQIALNALLNAPHDMIALVDREGTFLNINADGARRLGGTPEELIGQSSYAHLPPDLAESRRTYTDRVFMTGKPAIFDDERSGMYFHHEIFPVFNPEKTAVDYVAVFVREITSEKRAEDALKESERNLSRAQDVGHFGNWNWDITGNRLVWSDEMFRIFGVPLDFVPDYDAIVSMTHMDDREQYNRDIRDLLAGGNEGELEFRIVRPDGAERWVFQKIEVARDPQGSAIAAFGIVQDITDRKAAVQALFESEKKYRFLVDNILDSVWQTSPDLVFTYVSPAVTRQLGYSPEEVVGIPLTRLLTEPSARYLQGRLLERKEEFFQGNRDLSSLFEVEMVHRDGSIRSFEVSSTAVLGLDGSVEGFQGMTRDITERKRVKAALAESEERFRDLFSNMAAGVVIYTPTEDYTDFIIHDLNHAVETLEKVKKEEIVGRSVRDVFPGIVEFGLYDVFLRVARTGIPESLPVGMYKDNRISGWRENYVYRLASGEVVALYEDRTEQKQAESAMEESNERFRIVAQTTNDTIWDWDLVRDRIWWSEGMKTVFGYPFEDIDCSINWWEERLHPDDRERVVHGLNATIREGRDHWSEEYRFRRADGSYAVVNDRGTIMHDATGKPFRMVGAILDITERKEAEEALALSRVQLSHAMDLAHLVNWEFDMSNGIFTFNDQFYALYGTTAEREGGYQMPAEVYAREFVYPPDQHLVDEEVKRAIETTDPDFISRIEHRIVRRDGEIRTIVVRFSITKDADGRTIRTHGANEDISDIVRMQQALQVSEERQRLALDGAGAGFWDWDLKTGNAVFSSAIYSMLGYEPGDFPANYEAYFSLIHPNEREQVISEIKKQIDENLPNCEIEYRCRAADGNWIWISSKGKIVGYDNEGKPSRMTGVNIDITNWRLLESEIRSLNAVLEQRVKDRTEALQQANAALELENAQRIEAETKLQASYNEKVTLLKEIHHRVKNNLQIIASLLNLQSRYIHDDATLATIRESQNRVRAMALVHEKLYKADDISHISLGDYVSFLGAGLFQFYDAKNRGIRFQLDIEEVNVDINTAIPLGLIINELISNSLKYAFPDGRKGAIEISVKKTDHTLAVVYSDDGIGIPADLDWQNTKSLGLRLVNTLVDQLDGTIGLDRSAGTRFTMEVHDKEGT